MKRKFNDITKQMNCKSEYKRTLTIKKTDTLPCEICNDPVKNYRECISPYVYCSYDCLSIIILSNKNDYLDTNDLMIFDY